jgi:hypothetical protein
MLLSATRKYEMPNSKHINIYPLICEMSIMTEKKKKTLQYVEEQYAGGGT